MALVVNNPSSNAGDVRDMGSIPGSGRSPGAGHGNPLQYPCLQNPTDRGVWQAVVYRVAKSWIQLKRFGTYTHIQESAVSSKDHWGDGRITKVVKKYLQWMSVKLGMGA